MSEAVVAAAEPVKEVTKIIVTSGKGGWIAAGVVVALVLVVGAFFVFRKPRAKPIRVPVDDSPGTIAGLDVPAPVVDSPMPVERPHANSNGGNPETAMT